MYSFTCSTPRRPCARVSSASIELLHERAGRRVLRDRVLPQVAHDAAPRALAAGQEDRGHLDDPAVRGPLRFDRARPGAATGRAARRGGRCASTNRSRSHAVAWAPGTPRHQAYSARNRSRYMRSLPPSRARPRLRGGDAVLEAPLREHRHVEAGHRTNAAADDLPLQRVQRLHIEARQAGERDALGHRDDARRVNGLNSSKPYRRPGAYVRTYPRLRPPL